MVSSLTSTGKKRLAVLKRVLKKHGATFQVKDRLLLEQEIRHQKRLNKAVKEWSL